MTEEQLEQLLSSPVPLSLRQALLWSIETFLRERDELSVPEARRQPSGMWDSTSASRWSLAPSPAYAPRDDAAQQQCASGSLW